MVHALASLGQKETNGALHLNSAVAGSVYVSGSTRKALLWNPSNKEETLTFTSGSETKSVVAAPRTFSSITL
jgi:hypothetical protein